MTYSLLIGRWQPLHDGHKKLIQTVLDQDKAVCVAIRDTEKSEENPYTVEERRVMIIKAFKRYIFAGRLKIIVIPDINEIVYGRKVGYKINEIRLDEETEAISGTEIRGHMDNRK